MTNLSDLWLIQVTQLQHVTSTTVCQGSTGSESPGPPPAATIAQTQPPQLWGVRQLPSILSTGKPPHKQELLILALRSLQEQRLSPPLGTAKRKLRVPRGLSTTWDMRQEPRQTIWNLKLRSVCCLNLALKCHVPPYLHVHLNQLFVHSADDVQVFTLRLICCGIHWLHRMESVTLKRLTLVRQ